MNNLIITKNKIINTQYDSQDLFRKSKLLFKYYSNFKHQSTMNSLCIVKNGLEIIHHYNMKIKCGANNFWFARDWKHTDKNRLEIQLPCSSNYESKYHEKK